MRIKPVRGASIHCMVSYRCFASCVFYAGYCLCFNCWSAGQWDGQCGWLAPVLAHWLIICDRLVGLNSHADYLRLPDLFKLTCWSFATTWLVSTHLLIIWDRLVGWNSPADYLWPPGICIIHCVSPCLTGVSCFFMVRARLSHLAVFAFIKV